VHQVTRRGTEDVGLTLALPPDRIPLARIAELASRFTLGTRPREGAGWGALAAIHANARAAAGTGRSPTFSSLGGAASHSPRPLPVAQIWTG